MNVLTTLLPLILCLGQPTFSADVNVNILVEDKHISAPGMTTPAPSLNHLHHGNEALISGRDRPFQLRAITRNGKELNTGYGDPLYFDFSHLRIFPPRMALQIPPPYEPPARFFLDGTKLVPERGLGQITATGDGLMVALSRGGSGRAIEFTTIYSESASSKILAITEDGIEGDGNPDLFMISGDLEDLGPTNNIYACIPGETGVCNEGKMSVYLRIEWVEAYREL